MASLKNLTPRSITLPSFHVVPAKGALETTNEVIKGDNWVKIQTLVFARDLEVTLDPEALEEGEPGFIVPVAPEVRGPIIEGDPAPLPVEQTKSTKTSK